MKNKTILFITFCLIGSWTLVQAQHVIPAAGGNAAGSNGSVSYTIGQIASSTAQGTSGAVSQGIQQPYEIMTLGVDEAKGINLAFTVSPNPTSGSLKLTVDKLKNEELYYHLYTMNGLLLLSSRIDAEAMIIPMENLLPATYLLLVSENRKTVKTFKIIKN